MENPMCESVNNHRRNQEIDQEKTNRPIEKDGKDGVATAALEFTDGVAHLIVNKPPVNALDMPALDDIMTAIDKIEENGDVKVILITSGIEDIFCSGGDMKYWPRHFPDRGDLVSNAGRRVFTRIQRLNKPSIAAIQGSVIGDGLALALACDLRVATDDSNFHLPELEYGFIPGWGTIGRLKEVVGKSSTAELLFLGQAMNANRALEIGLVNQIGPSHDFFPWAYCLATGIAAKPTFTLQQAKKALCGKVGIFPNEFKDPEAICFKSLWGGKEWKEGIKRIFERKSSR